MVTDNGVVRAWVGGDGSGLEEVNGGGGGGEDLCNAFNNKEF